MGRINLLKSSFEGKVGQIYGSRQFGNVYAKAVPFSHTPHNEKQTQSFSAFQKLVRFSSGIVKDFSEYLPLETKTMTKTNATTKLLKPIIKNKSFNPTYLKDVIVVDDTTKIVSFNADKENNQITINATTKQIVDKIHKSAWYVGIFDNSGKIIKSFVPNETEINETFSVELLQENEYQAFSFASDIVMQNIYLHGLSFSAGMYIINGYLNIDAFSTQENYSIENNLLNINDTSVTVTEELLNINI